MATATRKPSAAELADRCEEAATDLKSAASALRHGRLSTAREKIRAAETSLAFIRWQWPSASAA